MTGDDLDADDVFTLIANENRLAIVQALAEAPAEGYSASLSFSELRGRVGMRDSGQFNYHLEKLVGQFVQRTDEGYRLRYPGSLLYRTIIAGFFTSRTTVEPFDADATCFDCDATLEAEYADGQMYVSCPDCGREYQNTDFPPSGAATRSGGDLLGVFDQYVRHQLLLVARGICYWCTGEMTAEIERRSEGGLAPHEEELVYVLRTCDHCGGHLFTLPGECVLYRPDVIAFCHEHGVDVTERPLWELPFVSDPDRTTIHDDDPWRIGVTVAFGEDELELVLDDEGQVVETARTSA